MQNSAEAHGKIMEHTMEARIATTNAQAQVIRIGFGAYST